MSAVKVNIKKISKSLDKSQFSQAYINWEVDGKYYPSVDWIDSGIIIISWWSQRLQLLVSGARQVDFSFMEGSYEIIAEHTLFNHIKLMTEEGDHLGNCSLYELASAIKDGAEKLSNTIDYKDGDIFKNFQEIVSSLESSLETIVKSVRKHS
ncbi:hypothetical protein [Deinococcus sp.]|uniref:hypothetical protein n=1 Tax=Deinococcus sp. TaxID=47478 RepID=UPI003B5B0089